MKTRPCTWAIPISLAAGLLLADLAQAQFRPGGFGGFIQRPLPVYSSGVNPFSPFYNPLAPTFRVAPGISSQQALFNMWQPLAALSTLPPWIFGYNPYPPPIITSGPVIPYYPPIGPLYNPYVAPPINPYVSGVVNPYVGGAPGVNPYVSGANLNNPYVAALAATENYNPYTSYPIDPYSGYLYGTASLMSASGKLMVDQERARLMRELALQARQQTRKMKFETDKYIKENTPTLTEEQLKAQAQLLKRIRELASSGEIDSGKAQNILLEDLARLGSKKNDLGNVVLDEEVLKQINLTTGSQGGSLALLRHDGQLEWPRALRELVPEEERNEINSLAKALYDLALEGTLKANQINDLAERTKKLQKLLEERINDLSSGQFLEARRFLNNLQAAVRGLRTPGLGRKYAEWLRFIRGGKSAQEIADFLNQRGLQIAPALPGDEGAYRVLYTALANYDIALVASNR
jgi:hypothetical protein